VADAVLELDPHAVVKLWGVLRVSSACTEPPGLRRREPPGLLVIVAPRLLATSDVFMQLLTRKGILAIAAVIDIALHARSGPVAAKALATRHRLPPRHLEPVLQALVRHGILKGTRGPNGGYKLAREKRRITADEILRAAGTVDDIESKRIDRSKLLDQVVMPALSEAEQAFAAALSRINIEELARSAEGARKSGSGR
jgi:Rrf2 family iron-sulfur cluster assembly transcriptional regulator